MVKLILHVCCAPCATHVVETLNPELAYFYNPNIHPEKEYLHRLSEFRRYANGVHLPFIEGDYHPEAWFDLVRGHESDPEGGERCRICFKMRLQSTAEVARKEGCDAFATTLTIGPTKNAEIINRLGHEAAKSKGLIFIPGDFKKNDGFTRSCILSREFNLYRQNYCGCTFSRRK